MKKQTPARRRAMGTDHTTAWLKNRDQAWADYESKQRQAKADAQADADDITRKRAQSWSDYHAAEAARVATRDLWPSQLDFAKENRRRQQEQDAQNQVRTGIHQAREDEQYEFTRQAQMEALAHPPRLQQQAQQHGVSEAERQRILDEASHPAHLRQQQAQKGLAWLHEFRNRYGEWSVDPAKIGTPEHAQQLRNLADRLPSLESSDSFMAGFTGRDPQRAIADASWTMNEAANSIDRKSYAVAANQLRHSEESLRHAHLHDQADALKEHADALDWAQTHKPDPNRIRQLEVATGVGPAAERVAAIADGKIPESQMTGAELLDALNRPGDLGNRAGHEISIRTQAYSAGTGPFPAQDYVRNSADTSYPDVTETKPVSEMTDAELEAELARRHAARAGG